MNILVTGASGFIGSHVCNRLVLDGHNVTGLDKALPTRGTQGYQKRVNIENYNELKKVFAEGAFDQVIHLAARAGVAGSIADPEAYWLTNVEGFHNVASLCKIFGVKKFIYASSSSVYGDRNDMNCKSVYAQTKARNEEVGKEFSRYMRVIGLRFFTVYGEYGRPEMSIYKWTQRALNNWTLDVYDNDFTTSRYYTYIQDVVDGISMLVNDPVEVGNTIYDIAGLSAVPIHHAAKLIKILTESPSSIITKENLSFDVKSCEPRNRMPGLAPTPFVDGIKKFISWAKNGGIEY